FATRTRASASTTTGLRLGLSTRASDSPPSSCRSSIRGRRTPELKNGSDYNFSELKLLAHTGTHVDAPGHFYDNYFDRGFDVDTLDLRVLNGAVLLVDVPRDKNITDQVMKSINIPKGVKRVLFRTLNTDRS
ncbi:cyclase-like protein 2, partial [Salvia miltiorrhiza]|uniref:cyclase-like protein 2 n=1 Tax=Salvia miltiorrhiza TaxID=226208 RepID=UPI0025AC28F4